MFEKIKSIFGKSADSVYGLFNSTDRQYSYSWTKGKGMSLYEKSLYTNKAIAKRAEKVGQINFTLVKGDEEVIENPWLNLLDRPNKDMTGDQFWRTAQKYYDIFGFVIIVKNKKEGGIFDRETKKGSLPDSLTILPSQQVEIVFDESQENILRFDHSPLGGKKTSYFKEQVIYLYNPHPANPLLGESLLSSAVRAIETEIEISQYQVNVLKNGGRLESVFKIKNPLNAGNIENLKAQYKEKYAESSRLGEPLFLGGDIDIEKTALSPMELAYLDTKLSTLQDICIATGVPKAILGVTQGETFSNTDASIRIFLRETIKPILENLVNVLDWQLIPEEFDLGFVDPTPEDQEEKRKNVETGHTVNALTINEKRAMLGFDPIPEGDKILVPFSLTELGKESEPVEMSMKKKGEHPLRNKENRREYAKMMDKKLAREEKLMLREVKRFFNGQKERLLLALGETRKRKNLISEAFNQNLEINLAKTALLPIIREVFIAAGQDTADNFNLPKFNFTSTMETALQKRAEMFSESIIATTTDQLQRVFAESLENNEGRAELVKRIEELYSDISKGRAEVIARTEVHNAMQEGNLEGYIQAGVEIKIWVTVGDDKVREEHEALDGEERPVGSPFSNGLMYPSEPNCRCSI